MVKESFTDQFIVGLPLVLYFLANILLGIAILRTGVLPRWSGVLLISAGLLQFDSNGPQPSGLPLLTGFLAAFCLLVVYALTGLRFWRGQAEGINDVSQSSGCHLVQSIAMECNVV